MDGWLGVHPYYSRVLTGMMSALEGADTQLRIRALVAGAANGAIDAFAQGTTAGAILANPGPAGTFEACRRNASRSAPGCHRCRAPAG